MGRGSVLCSSKEMIDELLRDAAGTPMVQGIRDRDSAVVSQSGDAFD